uniref:ABC transporter permease n=1 Tax=Yoonia sp. TaxID=2212373 RepID=UPI0040480D3C|tara:strand:- start:217 stop:966 length:750 start_codon:yes stop_codon:yes gene_type:complete
MRTIIALVLREMGATYGQSPGGYVWAIVQPIGIIVILSIGFSLLVRSPSLGTSFLLFYATGFLPFDMYSILTQKISAALKYSRPLLAYPRVTWLDAILGRFVLNVLTLLTVSWVVIVAIMVFVDSRTVLDLRYIALGFGLAATLGLGVGIMNCLLIGLFPVWAIVWSVLTRPMFIASGVLFLYEDLPSGAQAILWWNPVLHATGLMRKGFYSTYNGSYISLQYSFGVAMLMIAVGLLFMRSNHQRILGT